MARKAVKDADAGGGAGREALRGEHPPANLEQTHLLEDLEVCLLASVVHQTRHRRTATPDRRQLSRRHLLPTGWRSTAPARVCGRESLQPVHTRGVQSVCGNHCQAGKRFVSDPNCPACLSCAVCAPVRLIEPPSSPPPGSCSTPILAYRPTRRLSPRHPSMPFGRPGCGRSSTRSRSATRWTSMLATQTSV